MRYGLLALTALSLTAGGLARAATPDIDGVWVLADTFIDRQDGKSVAAPGRAGNNALAPRSEPKLKGEYAERYAALRASQARGEPFDEPTARCLPQGMPRFWVGPYGFEILTGAKQIHIAQEWNDQTRRIYVDGRRPPTDLDPSYNGYSTGHWEGNTLVIETVGLTTDSLLTTSGMTHSDSLRIEERFTPTGPDLLDVKMTATDPKAFAEPWVATYHLHRKAGMEIQEYVCNQNNRASPADPAAK